MKLAQVKEKHWRLHSFKGGNDLYKVCVNKNLAKPGRDEQNDVSRQVDLLSVLYSCP